MTKTFDRKLNPKLLADEVLQATPLLRHLLHLWAPAGTDSEEGKGLRLAIRDTYVNFYAQGQSLARVKFLQVEDKITFEVHKKYCARTENPKEYVSVDLGTSAEMLESWRQTALKHQSKKSEKVFVDALVAANETAIDMEMAFPGAVNARGNKAAPRADLVLLEPCAGGHRIVFWEAKLSTNPEARAKGEAEPEVVRQLKKYRDWFSDTRQAEVIAAYRNTCKIYVHFHRLAKTDAPLAKAITAVAVGEGDLWVDPIVRLAIDDQGLDKNGNPASLSPSFLTNGHEAKLRDAGTPLQVIRPGDSLRLPMRA